MVHVLTHENGRRFEFRRVGATTNRFSIKACRPTANGIVAAEWETNLEGVKKYWKDCIAQGMTGKTTALPF